MPWGSGQLPRARGRQDEPSTWHRGITIQRDESRLLTRRACRAVGLAGDRLRTRLGAGPAGLRGRAGGRIGAGSGVGETNVAVRHGLCAMALATPERRGPAARGGFTREGCVLRFASGGPERVGLGEVRGAIEDADAGPCASKWSPQGDSTKTRFMGPAFERTSRTSSSTRNRLRRFWR